ncbi:hypothetical protein ABZP36_025106 [Zizania latifolia]
MGNSAPRMRRGEATPTEGGKRYSKNAEAAVPPAGGAATVARNRRPGEKVADRAGGGAVVTVKVVMRKKDAERLAARLNEQKARGRKARMAELKNELRAGAAAAAAGRGVVVSPALSRDAWTQLLPPIREN